MRCRVLAWSAFLTVGASTAGAQMVNDGFMLPRRTLAAGVVYAHDSWDQYWEGTLKRRNGNIGTLTTESVVAITQYGVTDHLGVTVALPYIRTHASQGVLHDIAGYQDVAISAKYAVLGMKTGHGALSAYVAGTGSLPVSDYTPDFLPLSIGTGGGRATGNLTLHFQSTSAWFATASSAYTWCSNVRLNRSSYYTDGQLYLTNEVAMPNVLEHTLTAGLDHGHLRIPVSIVQRRTLGGGDIRRQDMPFVSNRMDFVRAEAAVLYALPRNFGLRFGAARVLTGRNVGQSTTLSSGLFYGLHL